MYANGHGVAKDEARAVTWYRSAAEQGDASAQNNLGVMYANGLGVAQDDRQAAEWYGKAAGQGHAMAQFNLGGMYGSGRGVPRDVQQACMWLLLAADASELAAASNRKKSELGLTPQAMAAAQEQAREWRAAHCKLTRPL